MSIARKLKSALAAVLCMGMLTACQGGQSSRGASESAASTAEAAQATQEQAAPTAESQSAESTASAEPETGLPELIRVAALKGPTAMGMIKLMDDESGNPRYEFTIAGAADEITHRVRPGKPRFGALQQDGGRRGGARGEHPGSALHR